jgi:hypothetical protein
MASRAAGHRRDTVTPVVMELARTELAAMTAGLKFWGGWVQSAEKYARAISSELNRAGSTTLNAREFTGRFTDLTRGYLRELAELPNVAAQQFINEMEHVGAKGGRTRRTKTKT